MLTQNLRFALIILKSEHELCDASLLLLSADVLATKNTKVPADLTLLSHLVFNNPLDRKMKTERGQHSLSGLPRDGSS